MFRELNKLHANFWRLFTTILNGIIRKKNDSDPLTSSDLDLVTRSLKIDWSVDYVQPVHKNIITEKKIGQ